MASRFLPSEPITGDYPVRMTAVFTGDLPGSDTDSVKIQEWWPLVTAETRTWLVAHNGEPLTPPVSADILAAARGATEPGWWAGDSADAPQLSDAATDWIETIANGEDPAPPY